MEPLIYYPTFEPPTDAWLKFSLLYFENFRPIIPYSRRRLVSDNYTRIIENTDLIRPYSPGADVGYRASLKAIEEVDKIFDRTHDRSLLFNSANLIRKWENSANWNFNVYHEKFSDIWADYCERNNIGRRTENGIMLPEELAFLFMTYLAKEIAFEESAAIITDNNKYDNFTNYSRSTTPSLNRTTKFAKGIINLLIPKNLADIPFERLIEFRENNRDYLRAFNSELQNIQEKIGEGYSEQDFINSYNNIYSEFSRQVVLTGIGLASIPFAAYMLIKNPAATAPEYVKEILGALGIALGGGYTLNKGLRDNETGRYCKKYITNLERIR
ncbi:hypothetical protein [Flavobacterium johnsoniae]|uniref:Uncharacterized protein n=1 Tax=Flavobacterium johnsoniae (strain ATCC 17061 / DSM 2064 / JCM 8514 / BCRC 14874 / CCUG 350202 / NBRC 14942 / NCIMB 11054 / UW101) TaxID=376686 RepID=A5FFH0_FLAJ1|nr:hypothetical protein [Flavobacterium johnsoniae]ABQ06051.1 hypothetical protein Fjoh_3030 [Flavobacterium johnsoniae UW101]OXG00587.1 hypothetical protein B0A63_08695 [Flavobacterium johnsoniae UW101]WQG81789.1 hypothetical protein SR927_01540 [Flavobacterium johnsoniae UW101]SHK64317.1 hypothetical protein SAMN05444146_1758 [Flavobacterium johnsoniae]